MIGFMLDVRSAILNQTTADLLLAKEALINVAQGIAKMLIGTNPNLVKDVQKLDVIPVLVKTLTGDECHHGLLQFEGLLALTNLASTEDVRNHIVTHGGWSNAVTIILSNDKNKNEKIVLAACELLSNLALTD